MKRLLVLVLAVVMLLSGCCYAPGYEGASGIEMRYELPKWLEADYEVAKETTTQPTIAGDLAALPTPEVDLDAMPERKDSDIVNALDYIPDLEVELKYATMDNFTGEVIYEFTDVYLRYGTVKKLMAVQQDLREHGYLLKVWDAYRPVSAQKALWEAFPDPTYVANPNTGHSTHSCGNTVDVTVVDAEGNELEMPTGFDEFSEKADRDYSDCTTAASQNAQMLESIMKEHGFTGYQGEWWHFSDNVDYPVENVFDPALISTWSAECNEYINLREKPDTSAKSIAQIKKDEKFTLLGRTGKFAYVEYKGIRGYVNADYMKQVG